MINFPKSWSELSVAAWQELNLVQSDNLITKMIEQMAIVADCDPQELRDLSFSEFQKLQNDMKFIYEPIKRKVQLKIEVDGKKYGMIPDLNFLTAGEFLDAENWKENSVENIHLYLALIYRPILTEDGDDYTIASHKPEGFMKRAELFREKLNIEHIYGTMIFFSSLGMNCMKVILDYSDLMNIEETQPKTTKTSTQEATKKRKQKNSTETGSGMI